MTDWIKKALTRTIHQKGARGRAENVCVEPDQRLLLVVKFSLGMTACLALLQVAHLSILGSWNSEIFAAITGLIGTVSGVLIGQRV